MSKQTLELPGMFQQAPHQNGPSHNVEEVLDEPQPAGSKQPTQEHLHLLKHAQATYFRQSATGHVLCPVPGCVYYNFGKQLMKAPMPFEPSSEWALIGEMKTKAH